MNKAMESTANASLGIPLGNNELGTDIVLDIRKLPHLFISGMTGTGKSTLVHHILSSLLLKNGPDKLRLILIDFKHVELTLYNSVPHLLTQVILEPRRAIMALKWLDKEIDRRHAVLKDTGNTSIESYHEKILGAFQNSEKDPLDEMPYILCVMNEFSDAMATYPHETERDIVRITQMGRTVGVHLILSTSRPNAKIFTAPMKSNIPARAIFQVSSSTDSRWVLGISGAETPRSVGNVLFQKAGMTFPMDIQTPSISDAMAKENIKKITSKYGTATFEIMDTSSDDDSSDDLYSEAEAIVREAGKASTSYIQRKLRIGYSRSTRLMDLLERRGVIEPANGSAPRKVINQSTTTL